jgi:quinoprotein glucose dehydrogenase
MPRLPWSFGRALLASLVVVLAAVAAPEAPKTAEYNPTVHTDKGEGKEAIKRFQADKSLAIELWASEPLLANPVCFAFDEKGRCYVAETFRLNAGVTDNRGHGNWLEDELASRTVADRVAVYKKYSGKNFEQTYESQRDRVRLLEDTTGSGKADKATVFRDDFGRAEDGIGAGLLARGGNVYFTCIPDLWLLKDTKGTGKADVKESLATGFGVHVAFVGHDMHGLRIGPDGRLYFSIGDRGLNVTTKNGRHLFNPDSGAVLRCEPDGSNMEIVHIGLRNPQELAFDDFGNLFTVDNNSDSGDRARFVYIVEGGDSGWRVGYQYGSQTGNRGPWNAEKLWHPQHEGQAAYIVPPLNNFADGPSGFTHYPGVGLGEKYKGHFFLCDFRGSSGGSGVWSFTTKPKGAAFEMVNPQHFVWSILATDCDFGPDCAFYISDWTEGWGMPGRGRIYKVTDPAEAKKDIAAEVKKLLAEGFSQRPTNALIALLAHPHQQVRQEAQFALAATGKDAVEPLAKVAKEGKERLARLHAVWGLGQIARKDPKVYATIIPLLKDADVEVRAQAARVIGPNRTLDAAKALIAAIDDPEPRVQFLALESAGRFPPAKDAETFRAYEKGTEAVVREAKKNADKDPYLRHALARALSVFRTGVVSPSPVTDPSPAVRMVGVLALRQFVQSMPGSEDASFGELMAAALNDTEPRIVNEAARMVHDLNMKPDLQLLAALTTRPNVPTEALYRALNAHFRLGGPENAAALAAFASRNDAPEPLRALALKMLGDWAKPPRRDYITGLTQNLREGDKAVAANSLKARIGGILTGPAAVQKEAIAAAAKLGITEVGPFLVGLVNDAKAPTAARADALKALEALKDVQLGDAAEAAIKSADPRLRNAARAILIKSRRQEILGQLTDVMAKEDVIEKQGALALLAEVKSSAVDELIETWLDRLIKKEAPPELQLDILEAAAKRDGERIRRRLRGYEESRPKGDDLAPWRETLHGGDAERGRQVFLNKAAVSCQRCHKLDGEGGEVGPPLNGLGGKQKRDYLLESIVLPNKQIAKGYDSVQITKADGKTVTGVLKSEDAKEVKVMTAEGQLVTVKKDDIDERRATKSAMPDDLAPKLTKQELRDLVEFLVGLKEEWKK